LKRLSEVVFSATLTAFQENTSATTAAMAETTLRIVVNM
jgi:hypothetical protein